MEPPDNQLNKVDGLSSRIISRIESGNNQRDRDSSNQPDRAERQIVSVINQIDLAVINRIKSRVISGIKTGDDQTDKIRK